MGVYGVFQFADVAFNELGELLVYVPILRGAAERTNPEPACAKPARAESVRTAAGCANPGNGHAHVSRVAG